MGLKSKLKDFVVHSTLLAKVNAARGMPTRTELDDDLDPDLGTWQLRQRFLDSFAWISSTSDPGAETAAAVCIEERNGDEPTVIRLARNLGVSSRDLDGLNNVLRELVVVSRTRTGMS
jgi:hypothetical protein